MSNLIIHNIVLEIETLLSAKYKGLRAFVDLSRHGDWRLRFSDDCLNLDQGSTTSSMRQCGTDALTTVVSALPELIRELEDQKQLRESETSDTLAAAQAVLAGLQG